MPYRNPEDRREYDRRRRDAKRGVRAPGVNPDAPQPSPAAVEPVALSGPGDIVRLLAEEMGRVRAGGCQATARTMGFLASVALKALEVADLARQIADLREAMGVGKQ